MEQVVNYELFMPFTNNNEGIAKWLVTSLTSQYDCRAFNALTPYGVIAIDSYLRKVITHKIAVREAGLELLANDVVLNFLAADDTSFSNSVVQFKDRLMVHDLSKFSPDEATGYAFYSFDGATTNSTEQRDAFKLAWHHHKMNNDHHPEYWFDVDREGKVEVLPMSNIAIVEMIADWTGAGKTYGNTLEKWLPNNFDKFLFHEETKTKVVDLLTELGYGDYLAIAILTFETATCFKHKVNGEVVTGSQFVKGHIPKGGHTLHSITVVGGPNPTVNADEKPWFVYVDTWNEGKIRARVTDWIINVGTDTIPKYSVWADDVVKDVFIPIS